MVHLENQCRLCQTSTNPYTCNGVLLIQLPVKSIQCFAKIVAFGCLSLAKSDGFDNCQIEFRIV